MRIARLLIDGIPTLSVDEDAGWGVVEMSLAEIHEQLQEGRRPAIVRSLEGVQGAFLAPVTPSKIVCVGLNYRHHAAEMGKTIPAEPLIFMKPPTAVIAPGEAIVLPRASERVDHEGELAIVMGRAARRISPAEASEFILGYTCLNDVTARDIQRREKRYTRAKGYDTFAPIGPVIVTDLDPNEVSVTLRLDGEVKQTSRCDDMIWDVPTLVSFISHVMTLLPGDVISTGTPHGVGPMSPGQVAEVEIDGVGILRNPVVAEAG